MTTIMQCIDSALCPFIAVNVDYISAYTCVYTLYILI